MTALLAELHVRLLRESCPDIRNEPCRKRSRTRLAMSPVSTSSASTPPATRRLVEPATLAHHEDEFVYVLEGEVVLVTDGGEMFLHPGDCAGFKAGDGHCLQNCSQDDAVILELGTRNRLEGLVHYPGIDLLGVLGRAGYSHTDGTPYPDRSQRRPRP